MKFIKFSILCLIPFLVFLIISCNNHQTSSYKKVAEKEGQDTLWIRYLDTFLIGEIIYSLKIDCEKVNKDTDTVSLIYFFDASTYIYFINPKVNLEIIKYEHRDVIVKEFIDYSYENGSEISIVDYDSPYLTGIYDNSDSIIVLSTIKDDLFNERIIIPNSCHYISITDKLKNLSSYFKIRDNFDEINKKLNISSNIKLKQEDFKIVLVELFSEINNNTYDCFKDKTTKAFSDFIVLSFEKNNLIEIQFADWEYLQYVFYKNKIYSKDIHLN